MSRTIKVIKTLEVTVPEDMTNEEALNGIIEQGGIYIEDECIQELNWDECDIDVVSVEE